MDARSGLASASTCSVNSGLRFVATPQQGRALICWRQNPSGRNAQDSLVVFQPGLFRYESVLSGSTASQPLLAASAIRLDMTDPTFLMQALERMSSQYLEEGGSRGSRRTKLKARKESDLSMAGPPRSLESEANNVKRGQSDARESSSSTSKSSAAPLTRPIRPSCTSFLCCSSTREKNPLHPDARLRRIRRKSSRRLFCL